MRTLAADLRTAGLDVLEVPVVSIGAPEDPEPLRQAIGRLASYDWIAFTSGNAVGAVRDGLAAAGADLPPGIQIASVGPSTSRAVAGAFHSLRAAPAAPRTVDIEPPSEHSAEGLAEVLAPVVAGRRVLLPLSDRARDVLATRLRAAGATVQCVVAYRTVVGGAAPIAISPGDLAVFGSPSAVEGFLALAGEAARQVEAVVIGPTTAAAARDAGLVVVAVAEPSTVHGLRAAVLARLGDAGGDRP
jgi:uroporphyrinogen-III synthase